MVRLALILTTFWFSPARAQTITIVNSQKEFSQFTRSFDRASDSERMDAWKRLEETFAMYYQKYIFYRERPEAERFRDTYLHQFFEKLPTIKNDILKTYSIIETQINEKAALLKKQFEDFNINLKVVILPNALTFNAKVFEDDDKSLLLILGIDTIVAWEEDLDILLTHELFHLYHFHKLSGKSEYKTLASALWVEGLATYVSGTLNPNKNLSTVLMDGPLATACESKEMIAKNARTFTIDFEASLSGRLQNPLFQRWFLVGQEEPSRMGYCLGYQIAKTLSQQNTLRELSEWDEKRYSSEALQVLINLGYQN